MTRIPHHLDGTSANVPASPGSASAHRDGVVHEDEVHYEDDGYEDGNALAGPLSEIFTVDVTAAVTRCAHCGSTGPVAMLHVYSRGPGWTARCPDCTHVVLRLVRGPQTAWLDMHGAVSLAIPLPSPS
ncbi:DUF6510 family protein [Streptomyces sp. NPDC092129]|uniref:DUF6510 family protein n=1 Tax=Streptomyces sp. NPDC092129 TaxID=3366010 RepID=UPI0038135A04